MKKILKSTYNLSIKKTLRDIFIVCVLLLFFTAAAGFLLLSRNYEDVLSDTVYENLLHASNQLDLNLSLTSNLADSILADTVIQEELPLYIDPTLSSYDKSRHQSKLYNAISSHLINSYAKFISYISLLNGEDTINTNFTWKNGQIPAQIRPELLKKALEAGGTTIWVTDYCQEYGLFLVKEIREARHFSFRSLGVLVICITPEALFSQQAISGNNSFDSSYLLLDGDNLIYITNPSQEAEYRNLADSLTDNYGKYTIGGNKVFAVRSRLSRYGWDYICMIPYSSISGTVSMVRNMFILIGIAAVFLILLFLWLLNFLFTPLNEIILKMQTFADGNFTRIPDTQYHKPIAEETRRLHTTFDKMADKITMLIEQNYLNELLRKDAQIKSLESQMSPHFLYNTLDTINWRAKMSGELVISQIVSSLAILLRMSLSKDSSPFCIRQELTLVDSYMTIQLLRHRRCLSCQIDVPEELKDCQIPRFTIQPLVENAVQYGLRGITDEICTVKVTAFRSDEHIEIEVKNNGSQFDEQFLHDIEAISASAQGVGVALANINRRLKISYGEEYGIFLSNQEDDLTGEVYAIACIHIPQIMNEC